MIAHRAFDYITVIDTEICAVNSLTVARTVATVMIAIVQVFIMDGSVAPLDVIIPHSNTIALEEVAHSNTSIPKIAVRFDDARYFVSISFLDE